MHLADAFIQSDFQERVGDTANNLSICTILTLTIYIVIVLYIWIYYIFEYSIDDSNYLIDDLYTNCGLRKKIVDKKAIWEEEQHYSNAPLSHNLCVLLCGRLRNPPKHTRGGSKKCEMPGVLPIRRLRNPTVAAWSQTKGEIGRASCRERV